MSAELLALDCDHQAQERLSQRDYLGRSVAIVGARDADAYGRETARRLAQAAAERGALVISGGARGVDSAAHLGALEAGGASVAILGCGLDRAPRRLKALREAGLGLVSPYEPLSPALPWRLAKRNEHIARLCTALIVVQALETSGSLISARRALSLGREVWVCPGPIGGPHAGCYALLQEGARLLSDHSSWLSALSEPSSPPLSSVRPSPQTGGAARRREPPPRSALYEAAGSSPMTVAELAARASMSLPSALSEATMLEMSGWLTPTPAGAFIRVESSA